MVEAVGCTKPALYYYFDSKEALYREAIRRPLVEYAALVESLKSDAAPFAERLRRFLDAALSRAADRPDAIRLILSLPHRPEDGCPAGTLDEFYGSPVTVMQDFVLDAQARGELRADVDPHVLASAIGALTAHYIFLFAVKGVPPAEGAAARTVDLLLHGAAP